ncbi:type IV pilin protein [Candidatus Avelusimicrobium faecicola]|uniref:type IV pilin protein n=1 Tax=Candidatus Avelusimicrobium faecicola TaxID=3416205 RepID=UPI003D0B3C57
MIKTNKGFTLIELLVVVLIIGILAAMAMPQYFKAVERSRMTEADTLLGSIAQAQRRKFLQRNSFTTNYKGLDVSPKGSSGSVYYTKGGPTDGSGGNGFGVSLSGTAFDEGIATATRYADGGNLQYEYSLSRYYQGDGITCTADSATSAGAELCADFCGIDEPVAACCNVGTDDEKKVACTAPDNN